MNRALLLGAIALAGLMTLPSGAALAKKASPVATLDTDNDGTVDLTEINKSAEALFGKLEKDNDGTVDIKEIAGPSAKKEFAAADPDNDGTLTKDEFLSVVADSVQGRGPGQ